VHANLLASEAPADAVDGLAFNVACGTRFSLNELFDQVRQLTDADVEPIYAAPRTGDVLHSEADVSLAKERFGYEPVVDFEEGLRRCVAYFDSRTKVAGS
jgi:nucleoside-diphosphate-sugar epimerase